MLGVSRDYAKLVPVEHRHLDIYQPPSKDEIALLKAKKAAKEDAIRGVTTGNAMGANGGAKRKRKETTATAAAVTTASV